MRVVWNRIIQRYRQRRRGAVAAEFALILPLLVFVILGCVDFGRFAYNYIAISNAARAGAAFGMMNPYTGATSGAWVSNIEAAVHEEIMNQTGYDAGLVEVDAPVPQPATKKTAGFLIDANGLRRVRVTVTFRFQTLIPWPGIPSEVTMRRTVEMRQIR